MDPASIMIIKLATSSIMRLVETIQRVHSMSKEQKQIEIKKQEALTDVLMTQV